MNAGPAVDTVRRQIAQAAAHAGGVAVLTGAGMSAESGIATFRDAMSGLWSRFDPAALASEEGFRADPAQVWRWYAERRDGVRGAQPNAGHRALADFERRHPGVLTVVSQNVDDLHQRAGNAGTIRLHGDILQDAWLAPCPQRRGCGVDQATPGEPPRCADCGNLLRPAVVWFGERLPAQALAAAETAARRCRVLLVVGTSGAVWPAAGLAAIARRAGATVVIVNPHPSEIDDEAHACLRGTAAQLLPRLLASGPDLD
ncbi:MAG: NAD-dependent protein deacylase [Proteobacteria bacterium]|nr:NAD-dependent protein deacylase [Pseudomonadota bacterium]